MTFLRSLSVWLASFLVAAGLPSAAQAATYAVPDTNITLTYNLSGSPATATITDCNADAAGSLAIPATLAGLPVTAIGTAAFEGCRDLASVSLPPGVATIGDYAFSGCRSLTSVELPSSVTSIGYYVFYNCSSLADADIPASVASIGTGAFAGCRSLAAITVSASNANYASFGGVLFDKAQRTLLQAPGALTGAYPIPDGVVSIAYSAFKGCGHLSSVSIPGSVTAIGPAAFYGCERLSTVGIPAGVTSIGDYAFSGCTDLPSIEVAAENTHYTSIAGVLYDKALHTLLQAPGAFSGACVIPDSVTAIDDYAFSGCRGPLTVSLPTSVTAIGYAAFYNCGGLANLQIPASVTAIGSSAFARCGDLTSIDVAAGNPNYASVAGVLFDKTLQTLIQAPGALSGDYTVPAGVTALGYYAFHGCNALTSVGLPASVASISTYAFTGCNALTGFAVAAENLNYASADGVLFDKALQVLIQAPGALAGAYTIPDGVATIGDYAFYGCAALSSVGIPDSVAAIGSYAFGECPALTSAVFEGHAPTMESPLVFKPAAAGFTIFFPSWASGFTTPTWQGFPAQSYSDGRLLQSITFPQPADRTFGEPAFALSATASSGLPVGFTVRSGPATVAGATLTLTGAGLVTIRATQPGDATYGPAAPVERSFNVKAPLAADLAAAIDLPGAVGSSSGAAPWIAQTSTTHDGVDALRSGTISHSQSSLLTLEATGPATLTFWWKVSSESGYDHLRFALNSVEQTRISGEVDWQQRTYALPAGAHTLTWSYTKDSSENRGSDTGWLDQVVVQSTLPPPVYATWRAAHFSGADLTNDAISGPDADPDAAGVTNFQRYAFDLPARGPVANPITVDTVDTIAGRVLTLTFPRRAEANDLTYLLESSPDLSTWLPVENRTFGPGSSPFTAEDIVPIAGESRRFLRLRVTASP